MEDEALALGAGRITTDRLRDRRRQLRSSLSKASRPARTQSDPVETLRAELLLLREENARLKMRAARRSEPADVRLGIDGGDEGDETLSLLAETLCTRDALLDLSRQIEESMQVVQGRLEALAPDRTLPQAAPTH